MDVGYFRHSKMHFAGWIVLPLVVVFSVHFFAFRLSRASHQALERRSAHISLLPEIDMKLNEARNLLKNLAMKTGEGIGMADALTTELQQAASEWEFTINSVSFDEVTLKEGTPDSITAFSVVVKGDGSLSSLAKFLHEIHSRHRLMVVEKANLKTIGPASDARFRGEFRFQFYQVHVPDETDYAHRDRRSIHEI